jgi:hypothetical protein
MASRNVVIIIAEAAGQLPGNRVGHAPGSEHSAVTALTRSSITVPQVIARPNARHRLSHTGRDA